MRLSWFISNSYSKSEMARNPLTITMAPISLAKSTTSVSNGSGRTLPWCAVALATNRQVDHRHDHLVEELRRPGDHVEVAVGHRVIGAGDDALAVVRSHGCG